LQGKRNIFVNGCFDVLHLGHIRLFEYAASLGDRLVVAIDSDSRVTEMKGSHRPINNQEARLEFLMALKWVDEVCIFSSDHELVEAVANTSPTIMVVGEDWKGKPIVGSEQAQEVKYFKRINGYSTTKIVENSSRR